MRRAVDVNAAVRQALPDADAAKAAGVEVALELDESLPPILADPGQLAIVFGNLVQNAMQAMVEGGRLAVRTFGVTGSASLEEVAISVVDTGVGIPVENLGKVFQPLFTTKAKGIGLGLALAKTLLEGHGGSIEVKSKTGEGSTFTVKLPLTGRS